MTSFRCDIASLIARRRVLTPPGPHTPAERSMPNMPRRALSLTHAGCPVMFDGKKERAGSDTAPILKTGSYPI